MRKKLGSRIIGGFTLKARKCFFAEKLYGGLGKIYL